MDKQTALLDADDPVSQLHKVAKWCRIYTLQHLKMVVFMLVLCKAIQILESRKTFSVEAKTLLDLWNWNTLKGNCGLEMLNQKSMTALHFLVWGNNLWTWYSGYIMVFLADAQIHKFCMLQIIWNCVMKLYSAILRTLNQRKHKILWSSP